MTRPQTTTDAARAVRQLPNLLIIGAAKCGTTSLHAYLDLHPSIFMSERKELQFFNRDDWRGRVDWYRNQFPTPAAVRGESSPAYSMDPWFPSVAERARELIPDARVIYLVRDPVERAVAQYVEHLALRLEERPIDQAFADYDSPANRYVMASSYAHQLDRWREFFADSQIFVIDQRDLLADRGGTLRRVLAFLGVDPDFTTPDFDRMHNERGGKMRANRFGLWLHGRGLLMRAREASRVLPAAAREPLKRVVAEPVSTPALDPELRARIAAHLRPDAERLRAYTGMGLEHWSV